MSKIGHVLVVPEPVIVVCNGCMIHNRKLLYVSSILKPKKNPKIQKSKNPIWHILDSNQTNQLLCTIQDVLLLNFWPFLGVLLTKMCYCSQLYGIYYLGMAYWSNKYLGWYLHVRNNPSMSYYKTMGSKKSGSLSFDLFSFFHIDFLG